MKTYKDVIGDLSKKIIILTLTPIIKCIIVVFSLIPQSKIITVHQIVTNVVKIHIYFLTLETIEF